MSASTFEQASLLSGRQLMLVVVIGLHAVAISALMAMRIAADTPRATHVFKPVTSITPVDPPPPPIRPTVGVDEIPVRGVPLPAVLRLDLPLAESDTTPADVVVEVAPPDIGIPGPVVEAIEPTGLQSRATRSPDEFYPASSQRLGEQGTTVVRVCVAPSGQIEGRPTVDRSSGSRNLDAAAVRWASEALAFTPATRNGSPVTACKGFRVNFTLR